MIMSSKYIYVCLLSFFIVSCSVEIEPYKGKADTEALKSLEDLNVATNGVYSFLKKPEYIRNFHRMAEYSSDNVSLSGGTGDVLLYSYTYEHLVNLSTCLEFWQSSYQMIYAANKIIEAVGDKTSAEYDQLKGENLFLRALAHFNLVRVFGRPYIQNPKENLGVMIRIDTDTEVLPPRSTVYEVYMQIIKDLKEASDLMTIKKNANYASKEVAYALLSRVYLYMGENDLAIEYANRVIDSERYSLLSTDEYVKYPTMLPEDNPEAIFAIRHTILDDRKKNSLSAMYYKAPVNGLGWGEMYASEPLRNILGRYPQDVRNQFIEPQYELDEKGNIKYDENGDPVLQKRNGWPKYYVNKYSWQEGIETLSSPIYLRLAEVYLNRAEAYAKKGNIDKALADINLIRERAGLGGGALFSVNNMLGYKTVFDIVMDERWMELCFECHRTYDIFRNNLTLNRSYPGFHLAPGETEEYVKPDDKRVVFFIPEMEIITNPNLVQNP